LYVQLCITINFLRVYGLSIKNNPLVTSVEFSAVCAMVYVSKFINTVAHNNARFQEL